METTSHSECHPTIPPPRISVTETLDAEFSIESLERKVDEVQRMFQRDTIDRLNRENEALKRRIRQCQRDWANSIYLLQEAYRCIVLVQGLLSNYRREEQIAESNWLAFWGIYRETSAGNSCYLPEAWR